MKLLKRSNSDTSSPFKKSFASNCRPINLNHSLALFMEYINMPLTNTSAIIIKHTFKFMELHNCDRVNYCLLKQVVDNLALSWKSEIVHLRKYIKSWLEVTNLSCFKAQKTLLNVLSSLFEEYKLDQHLNTIKLTIYDIDKKSHSNKLQDRKLIREHLTRC